MINAISVRFKDGQIIDYNSNAYPMGLNYKVENECLQVIIQKQLYRLINFYPLDTILSFKVEKDNE